MNRILWIRPWLRTVQISARLIPCPLTSGQNHIVGPRHKLPEQLQWSFSETFQVFGALTDSPIGERIFKTTLATVIYSMLPFNSAVKVTLQLRTVLNYG